MDQMERIRRARSQLVTDSPFFGVLALHLDMIETAEIETMATDGKRLLVNPVFAETLSDPELRGVLAHETYHCAADHMGRLGTRDAGEWNKAADYAINQELKDSGFTLPACALIDKKWTGMAAESIYAELMRERQQKRDRDRETKPASTGESPGQNGAGQPKTGAPGSAPGSDPGRCGAIIAPAAADAGEVSRDWKARVISAAAVAGRHAGTVPASIARMISENRSAQVSWREVLRRYITESMSRDYSWARPNRRHIGSGLYLPSLISDGRGKVIIAIDTSGSIDKAALQAFKGELQELLDTGATDSVTVLYCDCELQGQQEFEAGDILALDPKGGGGTAFAPVMTWAAENGTGAACLVYFTDLDCSASRFGDDPGLPVIWVNWSRPRPVPFGDVIQIDGHS